MTPGHGLGAAQETAKRLVAVLAELADPASGRGLVALDELGAALVAPLDEDLFDDESAEDRRILVSVLQAWGAALASRGWVLAAVPSRPPAGADLRYRAVRAAPVALPASWDLAPIRRRELSRWATRSARLGAPPPLVRGPSAPPPELPERASTATPGCRPAARRAGVPCVPAPGGCLRCSSCGGVTVLAEPVAGPRLPECECLGSLGVVCAHPSGPPDHTPTGQLPAARRASPASATGRGG